ncbi:FAD binding domain-containing protein [Celeribacter indicus]|uniref:Molybdopterin dehydrogenase FAD-binding protein n=1 Tax=Celeribacter indicus TaxID=1208324 RepID=A0A0B5DUG9_9RHOB|nr:xanthine dehydrogenase family protein subunit M [Celeribacter indicus]AJE44880.1 molybdopterin dehydrogenase FAD-binding protein [Celeribacter indicus]SDX22904.1 carbon-monoxide dehydrogenase medium subunit [Celeribacter indicus]
MNAFELEMPDSLKAAVALLDPEDPTIRVMSGGTALMLMMKTDVFHPTRLISLRRIEETWSQMGPMPDGSFRIGAMCTLSQMEHNDALAAFAPVIRQTMYLLSNVRVRNVATVGGALAHGDPHMDLPPVLVALDAEVVTESPEGSRRIPVAELHLGYYETVLRGDELIREVIIPPQQDRRASYLKCTTRAVKDWPALGVALSADLDGDSMRDARLVIGSVGERPLRVSEVEAVVNGQQMTERVIRDAGEAAAASVETIPDELGSAAYKTQLVRVHVERALRAVVNQNA